MRVHDSGLILAAAVALGLAGCDRGATADPNAQGSPGTGDARAVAAPAAVETPIGGRGLKVSMSHPGSSGDAVPGMTGSGTSDPGRRSQTPQPGTGLQSGFAGMGMTGSFPADGDTTVSSAALGGSGSGSADSRNRTARGWLGNR
jgi:hypothetical protein